MSPRRWDFISENRAAFDVKQVCRVLGVSRSGYYQHRATADARAYGAPRVQAELRSLGRMISLGRVSRLMRINRIVGRHLRRKKRTTIQDKTAPPVPDLVVRDFTADMLNTT